MASAANPGLARLSAAALATPSSAPGAASGPLAGQTCVPWAAPVEEEEEEVGEGEGKKKEPVWSPRRWPLPTPCACCARGLRDLAPGMATVSLAVRWCMGGGWRSGGDERPVAAEATLSWATPACTARIPSLPSVVEVLAP